MAFHHAGLTSKQRSIIEDAFRTGDLMAIVATPTLAAGVNLPARRVLVRDVKRWQDGGSAHLSVMEVRQMLGRAGRPGFDSLGEGWILAKVGKGGDVLAEADALSQRYLEGPVEDVVSHLAKESALRMHLLAGVANGGLDHRHAIGAFFPRPSMAIPAPRKSSSNGSMRCSSGCVRSDSSEDSVRIRSLRRSWLKRSDTMTWMIRVGMTRHPPGSERHSRMEVFM